MKRPRAVLSGFAVLSDRADQDAERQADRCGNDPAQIQMEPRQNLFRKAGHALEMQAALHACRQRFHKIEQGGDAGEGRNAHIYGIAWAYTGADFDARLFPHRQIFCRSGLQ